MRLQSFVRMFMRAILLLMLILVGVGLGRAYLHRSAPPLQDVLHTANGIKIVWRNNYSHRGYTGGACKLARDFNIAQFQHVTTEFVHWHAKPVGNVGSPNCCGVLIYYGEPQPTLSAASSYCPFPAIYSYLPETGELGRDGEWVDVPVEFQRWFLIQYKATLP